MDKPIAITLPHNVCMMFAVEAIRDDQKDFEHLSPYGRGNKKKGGARKRDVQGFVVKYY
ncbi:hypothetical protein [Geobacter sp. FeAm09]|uniref:hypothetical protein n=1 Tax=Geobacter sp. FeAm09 TaxID=2597769 RepID=UPI00143D5718|nr:hypothetical protein [Geobacter sp. FeAm09]